MIVRRLPSYLCHHGIKGQHWGVKNGPPYPLDAKISRDIKAGKNEDRHQGHNVGSQHSFAAAGQMYSLTDAEVQKFGGWDNFFKQPMYIQEQYRDTDLGLRDVNKFTYSDGSWKFANPLENDDVIKLLDSNFKDETYSKSSFFMIPDTTKRDIRENGWSNHIGTLQQINRRSNDISTHNNCSKCSDMVELVQRGFNPANFNAGRSRYGMLSSAIEYHWDGAVAYKEKSYENIERKIKSFGNHGSGTISIRRSDGSGHAMHFSVVKDRIEVQDGQIARVYRTLQEALRAEAHDPNQFCVITRLDQATPNVKHMLEDSVIRMDSAQSSRWPTGTSFTKGKVWLGDNDTMSSRTDRYGHVDDDKRQRYTETKRNFRYQG